MGTSSSNGGPSGVSSLLPSFYRPSSIGVGSGSPANGNRNGNSNSDGAEQDDDDSDGPPENQNVQVQPVPASTDNWTNAKGAFTRYTKNTAGSNIRKAARSYVRTLGGPRGATRSSARGIAVGGTFGGFLGSVTTRGVDATLTTLGLSNFIGRSSEEILAKIADAIAPAGATNDEAIARDAIIATLDIVYTTIAENGGDIAALESLTPEMIRESVMTYVSIYIFKKWVYELGVAVEKNTVSESQAIAMEIEIKDFITAEVKLAMQDKTIREFDLNNVSNQQTIETIFQTAYSILEQ
jgi:hypothetical protein